MEEWLALGGLLDRGSRSNRTRKAAISGRPAAPRLPLRSVRRRKSGVLRRVSVLGSSPTPRLLRPGTSNVADLHWLSRRSPHSAERSLTDSQGVVPARGTARGSTASFPFVWLEERLPRRTGYCRVKKALPGWPFHASRPRLRICQGMNPKPCRCSIRAAIDSPPLA